MPAAQQRVTPLKLKTPYQNSLTNEIVQDGVKMSFFYIDLFSIDASKLQASEIYNISFDLKIDFKTAAAEVYSPEPDSGRLYFGSRGADTTSAYTYRKEEVWFKDKVFRIDMPVGLVEGGIALDGSSIQTSFENYFDSDYNITVNTIYEGKTINIPAPMSIDLGINLYNKSINNAVVVLGFLYYAGMTNEFSFKIENFSTTLPAISYTKKNPLVINHYTGSNEQH